MPEKVLIVDDDPDIRMLLAEYVGTLKGYTVVTAVDGRDGLEKALAEKPELMIVDNQMPRMSGTEMLRSLRRRQIEIPAILTTAYGSEATAVEAFRLGVKDYIIKPFGFEEINGAVDRALREHRLEVERDRLVNKLMDTNGQLERRLHEVKTLHNIGQSVSSSLDLEDVLHRVVEAAVRLTGAEEGLLMLLDDDRSELYVRASKNIDSDTRSLRLKVKDSLAGQAMASGEPLLVGEDEKWQRIRTSYLVKSAVYAPLLAQNEAIGVLSVINRTRQELFGEHDFDVLGTLAGYAAVAIHNANLYAASDEERNKLGTILRQTEDPIMVVDGMGRLVVANNAARLALQLPESDLLGHPLEELIEDEEALEFFRQNTGEDFSPRKEISVADGRVFNASMTLIGGVGRSIVMQDITQLKELDRLKSEFVSVVSHDLRSPLTSIIGYVQLLERAGDLNDTQREFVRRVHSSVNNIADLISDLLDLGRLEAGLDLSVTDCSLNEIVRDIMKDLRPNLERKELQLELSLSDETRPILGDRRRLQQAIGNLVGNSIKYTPAGGHISVESRSHNGQIIMRITDTGVGISPADQPYIFDKFYRADSVTEDYDGTGLGLSIVKSVVENHRGRIWVESEPSRGTTFTIVLPIDTKEEALQVAPAGERQSR